MKPFSDKSGQHGITMPKTAKMFMAQAMPKIRNDISWIVGCYTLTMMNIIALAVTTGITTNHRFSHRHCDN